MGATCGEPFSGIWPRSGMTWRGIAFRLPPSALRTAVTGSSPLLGTPTARDWKDTGDMTNVPTNGLLGRQVRELKMLPTPNASMANYEEEPETWEPRRAAAAERHGNNGIGMPLPIALKLLPTPTAGDVKQARNKTLTGRRDGSQHHSGTTLTDVAYEWSGASTSPPSGAGSASTGLRLSPSFVEWMMGAPACAECGRGWTDIDCPHSVTAYTSTSPGSSARRSP
jgi:hypothetical protein